MKGDYINRKYLILVIILYNTKRSLAFYQSCNARRYRNESEKSRHEVHVLIIKSIIIFRSGTPSLYRTNIFSVLSSRRGQ